MGHGTAAEERDAEVLVGGVTLLDMVMVEGHVEYTPLESNLHSLC